MARLRFTNRYPVCDKVTLPVDIFSANGEKCLNCLCQLRGQAHNGSRLRLWKLELQKLADETQLRIAVCHFPPGTSKWNKIEHRLFSFISKNWGGKPLTSLQVIVSLIAATTTATGLKVHSELDTASYLPGIKVSDKEVSEINLRRDKFHGDWNYEIH